LRTISTSSSVLAFWADLVFLEAALLADEETVSLAVPITGALAQFTDILTVDLNTRRAVLQAAARGSVADTKLDGGLRSLFSGTLHLVEQDRKRVQFSTIFPENIGRMVRHALKRQVEVAVDIASKLALKIYPEAFRDERLGLLQPLIDKGKAVLDEQRAAEIARVDGRLDVQAWKKDVNAVRDSVYGERWSVTLP